MASRQGARDVHPNYAAYNKIKNQPDLPHNATLKLLTMLLHTLQEFDYNLTRRSDQHLALTALFGVCDCLQTIGED